MKCHPTSSFYLLGNQDNYATYLSKYLLTIYITRLSHCELCYDILSKSQQKMSHACYIT